jgi:hypothetical protein
VVLILSTLSVILVTRLVIVDWNFHFLVWKLVYLLLLEILLHVAPTFVLHWVSDYTTYSYIKLIVSTYVLVVSMQKVLVVS